MQLQFYILTIRLKQKMPTRREQESEDSIELGQIIE